MRDVELRLSSLKKSQIKNKILIQGKGVRNGKKVDMKIGMEIFAQEFEFTNVNINWLTRVEN